MALRVSQWRTSIGLFHQGSSRGPTTPSGEDQGRVDAVTQEKLLCIGGVETNPGPRDRHLVLGDPPESSSPVYQNSLQSEKVALLREIEELKSQISTMESQGDESGAEDVGYKLEDKMKQLKKIEKKERKENNPDLLKFQKAPPSTLEQEMVLLQKELQELRSQEMFLESLEEESDVEERLEDLEFKIESTQLELVGLEWKIRQDQEGNRSQERRSTSQDTDPKLSTPEGVSDAAVKVFYRREGVANIHGPMYEVKLSLLVFLRNLNRGTIFYLCTNLDEAGAFDDVVYKSVMNQGGGDEVEDIVFLQLKHRDVDKDKPMYLLKSDDSFGIMKYFLSYCEIERQMLEETDHPIFSGKLENCVFVMFTNGMLEADFLSRVSNINTSLVRSSEMFLTGGIVYTISKAALKDLENYNKLFINMSSYLNSNDDVREAEDISSCTDKYVEEIDFCKKVTHFLYEEGNVDLCDSIKTKDLSTNINTVKSLAEKVTNFSNDLKNLNPCGSIDTNKFDANFKQRPKETIVKIINEIKNLDILKFMRFSSSFFFLCEQSKEAELDKHIKEEIRIALRTTQNEGDVENIFNKLLKRNTKWSEKQGIVSYLDNCSKFWPRFVRKVQMKRLNAQSVYLKNLTIKFEEDKIKTLSERTLNNPGALCVVSEKGSLTISCLKIFMVLSESDTKDCVFVDSKWLMVNSEYIWSVWAGVWCTTLIILCDDHIPTKKALDEIKRVLLSNSAARIVFICSKDDTLPKTFGKDCVFLDEVYFSQLTVGSQDRVLGKKVTFQGHDVSIKSVIGTNSPDKYLKGAVLQDLICNSYFKIGEDLLNDDSYYIPRRLVQTNYLKKSILKWLKTNEVFAVSNITEKQLQKLISPNVVLFKFEGKCLVNIQLKRKVNNKDKFVEQDELTSNKISDNLHRAQKDILNEGKIVILDHAKEREQFQYLCTQFSKDHKVHWLHLDRDSLKWKRSSNDISTIKKYIDNESSEIQVEIVNSLEDNLVLVIAEPGMGKSSLLKHVAAETKLSDPSKFVLYINLNDNDKTDFLDEIELSDIDAYTTKEFIFGSSKDKEDDSKGQLLEYFFDDFHNTIILMDSFDEISPDYSDKVCALIYEIRKIGVETLWVTSRPSINNYLEDELSVLSYKMKPFSKDDQRKFLKTYWTLLVPNIEQDHLEVFIEELLNRCTQSLNDARNNFCGIPLQTKMLADSFKQNLIDYNDTKSFNIPKKIDLHKLFDTFIMIKCDDYCDKLKLVDSKVAVKRIKKRMHKEFVSNHKACAALYLFHKDDILLISKECKCSIEETARDCIDVFEKEGGNTGIIDKIVDGKVHFVHRSYAEYFFADWLCENYEQCLDFIHKKLFESNYKVCFDIFNQKIIIDRPLHNAVFQNNLKEVKLLIFNGELVSSKDKLGRTPLHLAAGFNSPNIAKALLDAESEVSSIDKLGCKPIQYGDMTLSWGVVEIILTKESCTQNLVRIGEYISDPLGKYQIGALFVKDGYANLTSFLLCNGYNVNAPVDNIGSSLLHLAADYGQLNIVKCLVDKGADINQPNREGFKPLHVATRSGHLEVVQFLVGLKQNFKESLDEHKILLIASENGHIRIVNYLLDLIDINTVDSEGCTALHAAVRGGQLEVVQLLVERNAHINCQDVHGYTALKYCVRDGRLDVLEFLVKNKGDINLSDENQVNLLHHASRAGQLESVKYLLSLGIDINSRDRLGFTALHHAIKNSNLHIVTYLSEANADVNLPDKLGQSPLIEAARYGKLDIVKYLFHNGAKASMTDNDGCDVFLHATRRGRLDVVKYLFEMNANTCSVDKNGLGGLHFASMNGSPDVVEYLVRKAFDVKASDKNGLQALHYAAQYGRLTIVKYLLEAGADISVLDNDGRNVLIHASLRVQSRTVRFFILKGVDVNVLDKEGFDSLYHVVKNGQLNLVRFLVKKGAVIGNVYSEGNTIIHIATENNHLDVLEYLVNIKKVDVNATNIRGETALNIAINKSYLNISQFLAWKGGQPTTLPICSGVERSIESEHTPSIQDNTKPIVGQLLSQLCQSVRNHRLDTFIDLLKDGGDINATDKTGRNVLHHVIKCGGLEFVRHIVDMGGDINVQDRNGFNALHYALRKGEIDVVQYLILKGADVNAIDTNKSSLIHIAVRNERLDILQCLVKEGGNLNIVDKFGCCALHYAVQHGNISLVKCLVENHANIELPDSRGYRCLHFSSQCKNIEVVKYLIHQGAELGAKDMEGNTALHISAQHGCLEVSRCLVEAEATIDTQNNRGHTALKLAKDNGHKDVVEYLEWRQPKKYVTYDKKFGSLRQNEMKGGLLILKYSSTAGDHVSVVSDGAYGGVIQSVEDTLPSEGHDLSENNLVVQEGFTSLHRAARSGKIEAVELAIREGAEINLRDNKGLTALHHAVHSHEVDVLNVLLRMKADCNIGDHKKLLPLHYAISKKSFAVVQCLVEGGSKVNSPDDEGLTALHLTAKNGKIDYIRYLLQNGADVNLPDSKGLTALHHSARNGTITNMMLLISKGANLNAQDKSGLNALHHASISGRANVVEYLVKMGVDLDILDRAGMTTFHHAVKHGRMETVEFLAEKTGGKVNIHVVDGNGFSALHHAAQYGNLYLFQYLVNKDLDINLTDNKGFKAMHYAEIKGHTKIVDFFSKIQASDP